MKKNLYQLLLLLLAFAITGSLDSCSKHEIEDAVIVNPDKDNKDNKDNENKDDENKDSENKDDENKDDENQKGDEDKNDPEKVKLLIADWKCNASNGYKKYSFRSDGTATYKTYYDKQKSEIELTYTFVTSSMKLTLRDDAKGSETTYTITTLTQQELTFGGDTYVNVTGSQDEDESEGSNQGGTQGENEKRGPVAKTLRGNGTKNDPYIISDATELRKLADDVYIGIQHSGEYFKMTADITINKNVLNADGSLNGNGDDFEKWIPIGGHKCLEDEIYCFKGNFDGNGHSVSGIYCTMTHYYNGHNIINGGLFGRVNSTTISNLTIKDSYIEGGFVGGIAGYIEGSSCIHNCQNYATIKGNECGGIYGWGSFSDLTTPGIFNCVNYGVILSGDIGGGIGGYHFSKSGQLHFISYPGGVVSRCINYGRVSGVASESEIQLGGIIGSSSNLYYRNCVNYGNVEYEGKGYCTGISGAAGINRYYNCVNFGTVNNPQGVSVGIARTNSKYSTVDNCVNYGSIIYGGNRSAITTSEEATITNTYYLNNSCPNGVYGSSDSRSGCTAMTESEMKSQVFLNLLNKNAKALGSDYSQWKFGKDGFPTLEFVEEP